MTPDEHERWPKTFNFWLILQIIDQRPNQTKSHLCDIKGSFPVDRGPAPDDDEEHGPQELRPQAPDQAHRPLEVLQADGVTHVDQIFSLEIVILLDINRGTWMRL